MFERYFRKFPASVCYFLQERLNFLEGIGIIQTIHPHFVRNDLSIRNNVRTDFFGWRIFDLELRIFLLQTL